MIDWVSLPKAAWTMPRCSQHQAARVFRPSVLVLLLFTGLCALPTIYASAAATSFRAETSVMGESSIIDKTTGRIFWEQGGTHSTLTTSMGPRLQSVIGVHFRATILSSVLWVAAARWLVDTVGLPQRLGQAMSRLQQEQAVHSSALKYWFTILLSFTGTILKAVPRIPHSMLLVVSVLYLLEAYHSSTHKYISHAVRDGAEARIAELRASNPVIEWKVRSFEYVNPLVRYLWTLPQDRLFGNPNRASTTNETTRPSNGTTTIDESNKRQLANAIVSSTYKPSLFRWKFVTNVSKQRYNYTSCSDHTVAGVWQRAKAFQKPPFLKIRLTKTVLLSDTKTRSDYFRQQREFLRSATAHNDAAEFTTTITVPGYTPRLLVVQRNNSIWLRTTFWIATCLGLTVPFRHWLDRRCDQVRVTVVKETSLSSSSSSCRSKRGLLSVESSFSFLDNNDDQNEERGSVDAPTKDAAESEE